MKALSVRQPWAFAIQIGIKSYETRSYRTSYRGELIICSSLKKNNFSEGLYASTVQPFAPSIYYRELLFGYALCTVELVDCLQINPELKSQQNQIEVALGDWADGRYAWKIENMKPLPSPFPVKGQLGFFNVELSA